MSSFRTTHPSPAFLKMIEELSSADSVATPSTATDVKKRRVSVRKKSVHGGVEFTDGEGEGSASGEDEEEEEEEGAGLIQDKRKSKQEARRLKKERRKKEVRLQFPLDLRSYPSSEFDFVIFYLKFLPTFSGRSCTRVSQMISRMTQRRPGCWSRPGRT